MNADWCRFQAASAARRGRYPCTSSCRIACGSVDGEPSQTARGIGGSVCSWHHLVSVYGCQDGSTRPFQSAVRRAEMFVVKPLAHERGIDDFVVAVVADVCARIVILYLHHTSSPLALNKVYWGNGGTCIMPSGVSTPMTMIRTMSRLPSIVSMVATLSPMR